MYSIFEFLMIVGFSLLIAGVSLLIEKNIITIDDCKLLAVGFWLMVSVCWMLVINTFNEDYMHESFTTTKNNHTPEGSVFSIMIPWAYTWQDEKMIRDILDSQEWGIILKIVIKKQISQNIKLEYNKVFIHYKTWDTPSSYRIKKHLMEESNKQPELRFWYSHTSFWNIRAMNWKKKDYDELTDIENIINIEAMDEANGEAIANDQMDGIVMWINEDNPPKLSTDTDIINEASKIIIKHIYFTKSDIKTNSLDRIKHVLWLLEKTEDEIGTLNFDNVWPIPYVEIIE